MTMLIATLAYLLAKHMVADFMLQTAYQYTNKGRYGHPGGLLHATIHAVLTVPLLYFWFGENYSLIATIAAFELVVHYHLDYFKEAFTRSWNLTPNKHAFWCAIGVDQFAHQLTYLGIAAYIFR